MPPTTPQSLPAPAPDGDPSEERALRWKHAVQRRFTEETFYVSKGDTLTDSQIRGIQEGTAQRWRVPARYVLVGHHGVPVLSPDVDLFSLPRELRQRPELFLDPDDRAFRDAETWADYAERVALLLFLAGRLRLDQAKHLRFLHVRRDLDPMDDGVWDRFAAGDPATVVVLRDQPMVELLGREMFNGALAASQVDADEFVGPLVRAWLAEITSDLSDAASLLGSAPARLLETLDDADGRMAAALEAKDPGAVVEAESHMRHVCHEVASTYGDLVGAYLSLAVPFSRKGDLDGVDEEIAAAQQYLASEFEGRFSAARGEVRTMSQVCRTGLEQLEARIDGTFDGEGPRYQRLPLNLIREYVTTLNEHRFRRKERKWGLRPHGVSLPWA